LIFGEGILGCCSFMCLHLEPLSETGASPWWKESLLVVSSCLGARWQSEDLKVRPALLSRISLALSDLIFNSAYLESTRSTCVLSVQQEAQRKEVV
jgi:hypothetical protein